jgi:hypothetical protein
MAAAKELPAAQAGRSAPRRAASTGKPRRSGSRSRWQRQPSPPPPPEGETARRKATQQASVGGALAARCERHGEMDTMRPNFGFSEDYCYFHTANAFHPNFSEFHLIFLNFLKIDEIGHL